MSAPSKNSKKSGKMQPEPLSTRTNRWPAMGTGIKNMGKRMGSLFAATKEKEKEEEVEVPEAKVDIALVGVEHAGKSTFFKQVISKYAPEDFENLVNSDGRSQAIGRLLKITLTILRPILDELETEGAKEAGDQLVHAIALYDLDEKAAKAIKMVWSDPVFLEHYRQSPFYQPLNFIADVSNCETLIDDNCTVSKSLHLKLHNSTNGYSYSKFTFDSAVPEEKEKVDIKSLKSRGTLISGENQEVGSNGQIVEIEKNSDIWKQSSGTSTVTMDSKEIQSKRKNIQKNAPKTKGRAQSIADAFALKTRNMRNSVASIFREKKPQTQTVKMLPRRNEVRIWDIGGLFDRRSDWEYFLRRSNVPLFFVSLADYSTVTDDGSDENLLQDSLNMFQVLCESDFLRNKKLKVVLTKFDVFEQKLARFKVPLNVTGLFPSAPDGIEEFDVQKNLTFIKEMFYRMTETDNSFLTRDSISFEVINSFDESAVDKFFVRCVHEVEAMKPSEAEAKAVNIRASVRDAALVLAKLDMEDAKQARKSRKLMTFPIKGLQKMGQKLRASRRLSIPKVPEV